MASTVRLQARLNGLAMLCLLVGAAACGGSQDGGMSSPAGAPPPPGAPPPSTTPPPPAAPPPVIEALDVHGAPPAGGSTLVISGTGFQTGLTVTFGGAAATDVAVDEQAGTVTSTTPPRPRGVYDLVVTNPDGQSSTSPGFLFEPPPVPTTFFPGSGKAGSSLTVGGTGFIAGMTGATRIRVGGMDATITLSVRLGRAPDSPVDDTVTVPDLPAGSYPVVAINPDGQQGTAPGLFVVP